MTKYMSFKTDGSATSGVGEHVDGGVKQFRSARGVALIDLKQVSCGTVANDADWTIWVDYKSTGVKLIAELLNPANVGAKKTFDTPFRIHPGAIIQFKWSGQAVAAANVLNVEYEEI